MKLVSTLMIGAAMVLVTAAPAVAQKGQKTAAAPAPKLGKAFRNAAAPVQEAVKVANYPDALAKLSAADAAATTPDEKFLAAQFRYQIAVAQKDQAAQATAIDAMMASGGAPATLAPQLTIASANSAYTAGNYPRAIQLLTQARAQGNTSNDVLLLLAESHFKTNQIPAGLAFVEQAVAAEQTAGKKPPEAWYARAASMAYKAKLMPQTAKWTREQVRAYPTRENWRSALVIYRDAQTLDDQLNLDLYRLMQTTKSLAGERDYFDYASLANERGLPGEAKTVIDEATAAGGTTASSPSLKQLQTAVRPKIAGDRASLAASERTATAAATGKQAASTADAYLSYGDNAKAATLYQLALSKGGVDADAVNTRLGIALARSGQKEAARAAFANVKGPRSEIAQFWTLYLDAPAATAASPSATAVRG